MKRLLVLTILVALSTNINSLRAQDPAPDGPRPRARVIVDNDFGGDVDGLFALAHQLLSPSVEVRGIVGAHCHHWGFYGYPGSSEYSCKMASELLKVMKLDGKVRVYKGADGVIGDDGKPIKSEATAFIIREAMRDDVDTPLYYACGGGLTDLASAYLIEPRIAKRIRLIWIGGPEHAGLAKAPPGGSRVEYNLSIDLRAGQVIFNRSDIAIWQIPRDVYRQPLASHAELRRRMDADGALGGFLHGRFADLMKRADHKLGETFAFGDSPLVLLTALQSAWEVDPSSSRYVDRPAPQIKDDGLYEANPQGRPIRVYTAIDTRLMFEDLYAKVAEFDER